MATEWQKEQARKKAIAAGTLKASKKKTVKKTLTARQKEAILLAKEREALDKRKGRKAPTKTAPVKKKAASNKKKKKKSLVDKAREERPTYFKKK